MLATIITLIGQKRELFFVTKLNENARYEVLEQKSILERVSELDGVLKDELISLKTDKGSLKARLVIFKSLQRVRHIPL